MIKTLAAAVLVLGTAQSVASHATPATGDSRYENLVRTNAAKFPRNFSAGTFQDNGPLVTPDIDVDSNNVRLTGRQKFVDRLKRYSIPFPGLQLKDRIRVVEGNKAATYYILQGEQRGPFGNIPATVRKIEAMSGELFEFDRTELMRKLITVTELDRVAAEVKGSVTIHSFEPITLLPNAPISPAFREKLRAATATFNQNYAARADEKMGCSLRPTCT